MSTDAQQPNKIEIQAPWWVAAGARLLSQQGLSTLLLIALLWGVWGFTDRFLNEVAIPLTKKHIEFIDKTNVVLASIQEDASKTKDVLQQLVKQIELLQRHNTGARPVGSTPQHEDGT